MKRQKRKAGRKRSTVLAAPVAAAPAAKRMNRRYLLRNLAFYGVAAVAVSGGGLYLVTDVMANAREHDLSRIGNGIPAIVQVHDPGCPSCLALQREARIAMESFESEDLQYLVANLSTPAGRKLADRYGVGRVTLLLMDGTGKRLLTLAGEADSEVLVPAFERLIRRSRRARS
jgi:hypothetical protein